MSNFTREQFAELEERYNLKPVIEKFKVKDGEVMLGDTIWWLSARGPKQTVVDESQLTNIISFPRFYQIEEPKYTTELRYIYKDPN